MNRAMLAAFVLVACAERGEVPANASGTATTSTATGTAASTASPTTWTMSETGWGPIRVGTSIAEAGAALGGQLSEPVNRECDHLRPPGGPSGVLLMVVRGQVARVEVSDTTVATAAGARVGDSEARINELYRGRVQTSPHKYVDGHYLIVRRGPGADSAYRLVFETDGRRVTRYRGGRMPEVQWIEGCS